MSSEFEPLATNDADALSEALDDASNAAEDSVLADVEVKTEKADGRQRSIAARIHIPHPADQIWQILTDYDHLAEFIPNLAKSQRIEHPHDGIRIEQIGSQSFLRLKFCARVVLDMVEQYPDRLDFQMVEGDFKQFAGSWILQPVTNSATDLVYTLSVLPPLTMPIGLIERRLKSGMALNLTAIRQRADRLFA